MKKCVVCGSSNSKSTLLSFHRFPKDQELRQKWANACSLTLNSINENSLICSKHFKLDDFDEGFWPRRRLVPSAVPAPSLIWQSKNISPIVCGPIQSPTNVVVDIQESVAGSSRTQEENMQSMKTPPHRTSMITEESSFATTSRAILNPRYVGDLTVEHFLSPCEAKRNLTFVKDVIDSQRKKLRVLQVQKRRLERRIDKFKDLLEHLRDSKMISEEAFNRLMAGVH